MIRTFWTWLVDSDHRIATEILRLCMTKVKLMKVIWWRCNIFTVSFYKWTTTHIVGARLMELWEIHIMFPLSYFSFKQFVSILPVFLMDELQTVYSRKLSCQEVVMASYLKILEKQHPSQVLLSLSPVPHDISILALCACFCPQRSVPNSWMNKFQGQGTT